MARQERDKLRALCDATQVSTNKLTYATDKGRWIVKGKRAQLVAHDPYWTLSVQARSKRHQSSIKKQLRFMQLVSDSNLQTEFKLDRMPTEAERPIIRKIAGLNKTPALSKERRKQLKNHAEAIRGLPPLRKTGVSAFLA